MVKSKKEILDIIRDILIDYCDFVKNVSDDKLLNYTLDIELNFNYVDFDDFMYDLESEFKIPINIDFIPNTIISEIIDYIYENQ